MLQKIIRIIAYLDIMALPVRLIWDGQLGQMIDYILGFLVVVFAVSALFNNRRSDVVIACVSGFMYLYFGLVTAIALTQPYRTIGFIACGLGILGSGYILVYRILSKNTGKRSAFI